MEIKQFKLSSGEEIVCDVVEWPDVESDSADIVVRNILKIVAFEQPDSPNRFYVFKPWMVFQDEEGMLQMLNNNHIVGEANPSEKLIEQYLIAIGGKSADKEVDVQKQLEEYVNGLREKLADRLGDGDSDTPTNIVSFPGRTLH